MLKTIPASVYSKNCDNDMTKQTIQWNEIIHSKQYIFFWFMNINQYNIVHFKSTCFSYWYDNNNWWCIWILTFQLLGFFNLNVFNWFYKIWWRIIYIFFWLCSISLHWWKLFQNSSILLWINYFFWPRSANEFQYDEKNIVKIAEIVEFNERHFLFYFKILSLVDKQIIVDWKSKSIHSIKINT